MPVEVVPPKYVVIVNAVQERIENGTYPPGRALPTETELMAEFHTSRPTVVRSLDMLRRDGWIESHQGKGRFVLGAPARVSRGARQHSYALLDADEKAVGRVLSAGLVTCPPRAAHALGIEPVTPVFARRRLVVSEDLGPVELGSVYVPVELAVGTNVTDPDPLPDGLLHHLAARKGVVFDHATERISARPPTADEAELLEINRREPVLTVLLSVCDRTGKPLIAADVLLPASRHELEDVFPIG